MAKLIKSECDKIKSMIIILKAKFNTLVKEGNFQQALGMQTGIEMIEEFYAKELRSYEKETTNRKND